MIRGAGRDGKGMAASGPGATSRVEGGIVLAHPRAHPPRHRPPHRQRAPSHGDMHMGTRRGHHPMAPPGGQSRPARRGALQNWGACVRRRPVPAGQHSTYDFSSCFFPKFKKSAKRGFSREMTYFFGFYGPKIGGGVHLPEFCPKKLKTLKFGLFWGIFACSGLVLQNSAAHQCTCL